MTEERLQEITANLKYYGPMVKGIVGELLEALREAQADFEDMKHVAFGNQKYVDAEQRGYQRGIEAAIGVIGHYLGHGECCGCWGSRNEVELKRLQESIRTLLPVAATNPTPAEDADPHRAQRLRFIEGCKEIGKVLKGTPMDETLQRVTVSLTPTQIEWLRTKGNLSEVIRTIVEKEQNATS